MMPRPGNPDNRPGSAIVDGQAGVDVTLAPPGGYIRRYRTRRETRPTSTGTDMTQEDRWSVDSRERLNSDVSRGRLNSGTAREVIESNHRASTSCSQENTQALGPESDSSVIESEDKGEKCDSKRNSEHIEQPEPQGNETDATVKEDNGQINSSEKEEKERRNSNVRDSVTEKNKIRRNTTGQLHIDLSQSNRQSDNSESTKDTDENLTTREIKPLLRTITVNKVDPKRRFSEPLRSDKLQIADIVLEVPGFLTDDNLKLISYKSAENGKGIANGTFIAKSGLLNGNLLLSDSVTKLDTESEKKAPEETKVVMRRDIRQSETRRSTGSIIRQPIRRLSELFTRKCSEAYVEKPKDYMLLACVVYFCCNFFIGGIAFGFSLASNSAFQDGDADAAKRHGKRALYCSIIGIAVTFAVALALVMVFWPKT